MPPEHSASAEQFRYIERPLRDFRGFAWLDTGTHESLLEAAQYIETVQRMQNVQVANLEEIAYRMGYITKEQVHELAQPLKKNEYGHYLLRLIGEE